ncbi:MAG: succinylglutamate desuccinylase/aspartoacylase family protein [bacterium]
MKVLVIGGMHGNETLGIEVVKLFKNNSVNQVDTFLANEQAIKNDCRFVGQDLNRSFPGDKDSANYEIGRAAQILELTKKYDIVLDFHNTYCPNNDCAFVGQTATQLLDSVAVFLGLKKVIIADYDCINKFAPNCLSVEVSVDSQLNKPEVWYDKITQLSRLDNLIYETSDLEKYRFVYRMTLDDKDKFNLTSKQLRAFKPISNNLAIKLGVTTPAYPIFVDDNFTPYNYGGLLTKI